MKITEKEVRYVADLARLDLSSGEVSRFTGQLDRILEYVDQLRELDTSRVEPTSHVLDLRNVLRDDEPGLSLPAEEALENAPRRDRGHFTVPKIIE